MIKLKIYICGNGNLSFENYLKYYQMPILDVMNNCEPHFIVCDFRGVDTLSMELLKCKTPHVTVLHVGKKPRYLPDKYKTEVSKWNVIGDFISDLERDSFAINLCTHFLAIDFNTDKNRKSGTLKNIETCLKQNKVDLSRMLL